MNRRLLEYNLPSFNYKKIKNKHYVESFKGRLISNYFLNKYGLDAFIKVLKYYSDRNFFKHLEESFPNQFLEIQKKFKINLRDKNERLFLFKNGGKNICLGCSEPIKHHKNKFCSVRCSNIFKSKDEIYLKNLSLGVKSSYLRMSAEDLKQKHLDISKSVKLFNSELTEEERKLKYINKTLIFDAFKNFSEIQTYPELLCSEEFFYKNREIPVKCKVCDNEWLMTRSTSYSKIICRVCTPFEKHKTQSEIENHLKDFTITKMNDRTLISPLEIDIIVPEFNFAIEYDGLMFHSYGMSKYSMFNNFNQIDKKYHSNKTNLCEAKGFQLFHIFENEWLNKGKQEIWKSIIDSKLQRTRKIPARKCVIREVDNTSSSSFLEANHLQGNCGARVKLGLYYDEELVSLMTFGTPRENKKYQWELIRFCSKLGTTVQGGGSKLLKFFERNYNPESLISYANRRWSEGNFYEKLGFEFLRNTEPNYFYLKDEKTLFSRNKFQKHKLPNLLEFFDPNKTEIENMFLNGYRIIFDSGNKVYSKEY